MEDELMNENEFCQCEEVVELQEDWIGEPFAW